MITIMDSINNHFIKSRELGQYEITTDSVKGNFVETYLAGMYLIIKGSFLNDGIYKITEATNSEITVDATLQPENTDESIFIFGSAPPKAFVDLATEIENYSETGLGVSSESIDDYSVSYGNGSNADGSWESVYKNKLNTYRRVYDDLKIHNLKYRWQDRW